MPLFLVTIVYILIDAATTGDNMATKKVNGVGFRPNTAVISANELRDIRAQIGTGTYNRS